jgi:type I restriction enzyme, S subunit
MINIFDSLPNPQNFPLVAIRDLVIEQRGGASFKPQHFTETGFPVLHKGAIKAYGEVELDSDKKTYTTDEIAERFAKSSVDRRYVAVTLRDLVPSGPTIGMASNLVKGPYDSYILAQGAYGFLLDKTCIHPDYLVWLSNTKEYRQLINALAVGSTQIHVRTPIFLSIKIPLPPLHEQMRIAAILEDADHARRTRHFTQSISSRFLQEVFVQMFGDPATNPLGWDEITLGDVITAAKDGPHVSPQYVDNGVPILSTRNVRPGQMIWDDLKYISWEDAETQWKKIKPELGDILYTKGGTTGLAKSVDFELDFAVWVHIAVLKLRHNKVVPVWLENMLNTEYCYHQSQQLTFGIVNRDLGLKRMPRIKMYLPPRELQEKFAEIVSDYSVARVQQQESARQADHLFQTLLHRAFCGEL